jgi:hypothetical protein
MGNKVGSGEAWEPIGRRGGRGQEGQGKHVGGGMIRMIKSRRMRRRRSRWEDDIKIHLKAIGC